MIIIHMNTCIGNNMICLLSIADSQSGNRTHGIVKRSRALYRLDYCADDIFPLYTIHSIGISRESPPPPPPPHRWNGMTCTDCFNIEWDCIINTKIYIEKNQILRYVCIHMRYTCMKYIIHR